jgi:hypothetical protein
MAHLERNSNFATRESAEHVRHVRIRGRRYVAPAERVAFCRVESGRDCVSEVDSALTNDEVWGVLVRNGHNDLLEGV